jgi:WD repeat-containing protein 19
MIFNIAQANSTPNILNFEPQYGEIVNYHWFGSSMIVVGFSKGWILALSTEGVASLTTVSNKEASTFFKAKCYQEVLGDLAISRLLNLAVTCGDNVVKIYDLSNLQVFRKK